MRVNSETTSTNQTSYSYHSPEAQQVCVNITFIVSAVSDLGPSPAASRMVPPQLSAMKPPHQGQVEALYTMNSSYVN